jgi:regulator of sigma E protease
MILNIIIFIAVLALLVLVHEFGHFLAAKKFKMYVEEFGFGFPPKLKGWKKGETTWSINAIPLGGFVRIAGEDGEVGENDFITEEKVTAKNEIVEIIESPAKEIIIEEKITEIDKAAEVPRERFFSSKPVWQRAVVLISGVLMNFILGWLILVVVFLVGTKPVVIVSQVMSGSPAQTVGIKEGDKISGFSSVDALISYVDEHKGQEISLTLLHNGQEETVKVTPRADAPQGEGPLGVGLMAGGAEKESFFKAIADATKTAFGLFIMIYALLFKLIVSLFGGANVFKYVSGPVGIFEATSQAAGLGMAYLANLVALISLNLAALNIFPFPALDGGRVLFLIIEKIKGSPISVKIQQIVNGIGFALLLILLLATSVQDVVRLFH